MAKITNHSLGLRGIRLKDGSTTWLESGQSADIKKDEIAGDLPDLGKASDAPADEGANAKQIEELTAAHEKALKAETDRADAAEKALADAQKQLEELTAPKDKAKA